MNILLTLFLKCKACEKMVSDMMAKHMAYQLRTLYVMHLLGHSLGDPSSTELYAFCVSGCNEKTSVALGKRLLEVSSWPSGKLHLSGALLSHSSYIPKELARKPRGMDTLKRWKATEFRLFFILDPSLLQAELPKKCVITLRSYL